MLFRVPKSENTRSKSPKVKKRKIMKKKDEEETQKSTKPKIQIESYASFVKRSGVNFGNPVMKSSLEDLNIKMRQKWKSGSWYSFTSSILALTK